MIQLLTTKSIGKREGIYFINQLNIWLWRSKEPSQSFEAHNNLFCTCTLHMTHLDMGHRLRAALIWCDQIAKITFRKRKDVLLHDIVLMLLPYRYVSVAK